MNAVSSGDRHDLSVCLQDQPVSAFFSSPTTLQQGLLFSPACISGPLQDRLILLQLLHALHELHSRGISLAGRLNVRLSPSAWTTLQWPGEPEEEQPTGCWWASAEQLNAQYSLPELTARWQARLVSNFDYLVALNLMACRRPRDRSFHPIMPWVLDFSCLPQELHCKFVTDCNSQPVTTWSWTSPACLGKVSGTAIYHCVWR